MTDNSMPDPFGWLNDEPAIAVGGLWATIELVEDETVRLADWMARDVDVPDAALFDHWYTLARFLLLHTARSVESVWRNLHLEANSYPLARGEGDERALVLYLQRRERSVIVELRALVWWFLNRPQELADGKISSALNVLHAEYDKTDEETLLAMEQAEIRSFVRKLVLSWRPQIVMWLASAAVARLPLPDPAPPI